MNRVLGTVKQVAVAAVMLMTGIGTSQGALILWSNGPNYNGANGFQGIMTNGSLVAAFDLAGSAPLTVDPTGLNITFTPINSPVFTAGSFASGTPGSTDAAWNSIIDSTEYSTANFTAPGFLTGLTIGDTYQVQFFASDSRGCCSARTSSFSNGVDPASTPVVQGTFTSVVGLFTADGTSQTIGFSASSNEPILSAYVLRDLTTPIPEPATYALMLAGLAALGISRRKKA